MYIIRPWKGLDAVRELLLFTTIVAAFQLHAAAQSPVSEDVPVPADVVAHVRALGLDAAHNRARFIPETARVLLTPIEWRSPVSADGTLPQVIVSDSDAHISVPVPLTA